MLLGLFYLLLLLSSLQSVSTLSEVFSNSWKNSPKCKHRDKMKSTNQWKYMQANKIMLSTILSKFVCFPTNLISVVSRSVVPQTSSTRSQDLVRNDLFYSKSYEKLRFPDSFQTF